MKIERLIDLDDFEFDTLLITYNQKDTLSLCLDRISDIFAALKEDGLVGGSQVYGIRGRDFSYKGRTYYNMVFIGVTEDDSPRKIQLQYGTAMKEVKRLKGRKVLMMAAGEKVSYWVESALRGLYLADYQFNKYKSVKQADYNIEVGVLTTLEPGDFKLVLNRVSSLSQAVVFARDLANEPANYMTPEMLASEAAKLGEEYNMKTMILGPEEIADMGMGAFLAVAKGSLEEPRFIVLEYNGRVTDKEKLALVGKGICFDSGGYNVKIGGGMTGMKCDMSGAAAVLGALKAIAEAKLEINVLAVIPACENMISGGAARPGDVVESMSGKYIEIENTDAEGRLTLADAITYAVRTKRATAVIDIATLTGACVVALGDRYIGTFSNDDVLMQKVIQSSVLSGEAIWRLPLCEDEYKDINASMIADIKNTGSQCGATAAAGFIQEFVEGVPWVHFDIAGTAQSQADKEIFTVGATGSGVVLLYEIAKSLEKPHKSY
ncbi:MAG: leucyl aminopeptidase [Lachnospiraceae bacterium]|nr:leucyl aminopeptidase [Lachnospiraceae bacterium]